MQVFKKRQKRIKKLLTDEFNPTFIEIIDNSMMHAGHSGFDSALKETHLLIKMKTLKFKNLNRKDMHQKVYSLLKQEFANGLHALELDLGS